MAIIIQPQQIQNPQQLEAVVAGPDGANRLFVVTGQMNFGFGVNSQGNFVQQNEVVKVLIGPVLTRQQFFRAIASASLNNTMFNMNTVNGNYSWRILDADADWDDESGQVELRIEIGVSVSGANNSASIQGLGFQVTILAALQP